MTAALTLNFRKPGLTVHCIRALLADGWGPILVWDNSDDGGDSARIVKREFAANPEVHVVASASNLGFAAGVNQGLDWLVAHGQRGPVLVINNDARVLNGARVAMLRELNGHDRPVLVAPMIEREAGNGWLHYQPWFGLVLRRPVPGSFRYLSGCCLLVDVPRLGVPLLDEDFFMYGEDVQLCCRVASNGLLIGVAPAARVEHLGSASSGMGSDFYEWHMVRAHWLLAAKLAPHGATRIAWRALRVPTLLLRALLRCVRYRKLAPIRALRAMVGWP